MTEEKIKKESERFFNLCTGSSESKEWAKRGFIAGVNWLLTHQWVSVDDELPELEKLVLVYNGVDISISYRTKNKNAIVDKNSFFKNTPDKIYNVEIKYWMPIHEIKL